MKSSSNFLRLLFISLFLISSSGIYAQDTLKFLMIGNSFSGNSLSYLSEIADEAGFPLTIGHAGIGGASMQKHWDLAELVEKEPDNPDGKPYNGRSLKEVLAEQDWDIVSIQQVSWLSGDTSTYHPYDRNLYELIKEVRPEARVVLHETWAYRIDSKDFSQIPGGERATSSDEMWQNVDAAYTTIATELGIEIMPVGDAFWKVSSNRKWGYKPDNSFDEDKAVYPELPDQKNSLHSGYSWRENGELRFDSHHAGEAGRFLGSLVLYSYLSEQNPKKLDFVPGQVPEKFARYLKKTAWSVTKSK